jgi:hypothetical protein
MRNKNARLKQRLLFLGDIMQKEDENIWDKEFLEKENLMT